MPKINYQNFELFRFLVEFNQNQLHLYLTFDTKSKFDEFKATVDLYNTLLKNEEDLKKFFEQIKTKYNQKKEIKDSLEKENAQLKQASIDAKTAYETANEKFLKLRGKIISLENKQTDLRTKSLFINPKKNHLTLAHKNAVTKQSQAEDEKKALIGALQNDSRLLAKNKPKLKTLKELKGKLDAFVSKSSDSPSLILLNTYEDTFQQADDIAKKAKSDMEIKEEDLNKGTESLTKAQEKLELRRAAMLGEAQKANTALAESRRKLKKAKYDSARLQMFKTDIEKCQAIMTLYQHKIDDLHDSKKKLTSLRTDAQNGMQKMIKAKAKLAFKKYEINRLMARLGHLKEPMNTRKADEAKNELLDLQLERHKIDQDWRTSPENEGVSKRAAILGLLRDEERALSNYFSSKMLLASNKNLVVQEHRKRCRIHALLAFIDLFFNRIQFELVRYPKERPGDKLNILTHLKNLIEKNEILKNLVTQNDKEETPVQRLVNALIRDEREHPDIPKTKDPKTKDSKLYFFLELKEIVTLYDSTTLLEHKIPILIEKFYLIHHLTTKPFKKDAAYDNNHEKYLAARKDYRKEKYQKKTDVEQAEITYIANKNLYKNSGKKPNEAEQHSYMNKEALVQLPMVQKVSYLAPSVILAGAYYFGVPNLILSGVSAYLSYQSGMVILSVMTSVHFCLQSIFASTVLGSTKSAA